MHNVITKWGRLTRPINKKLVLIRWMGCRIAVHDFTLPCESGEKVRKNPEFVARNRRGRRSTRGGRKRRALTGAAPQATRPSVSRRVVSDRIIYKRMRLFDYSRRIIDSIKVTGKALSKNRYRLDNDRYNVPYQVHYEGCRRKLLKLCKQWRTLRAATHGEPDFAIEYAFALEVGDDIPFRGNITKVRTLLPYFRPLVDGIVQAPPISSTSNRSEDTEHTYWCTRCARSTNLRLCRMCGAELAPPVHGRARSRLQPRRVVAKAQVQGPSTPAPPPPVLSHRKKRICACPLADGCSASRCRKLGPRR